MNTTQIAHALCADNSRDCWHSILPPWHDDDEEAAICRAFADVKYLKRQHAGLVEIWPLKKAQFDEDFRDKLMEIAADVHEQIQPHNA